MTKTEGAGIIEVEQEATPHLLTRPTPNEMWIKYKQSTSAMGVIIERWQEAENADDEAAWLNLARKARSRFAHENPY